MSERIRRNDVADSVKQIVSALVMTQLKRKTMKLNKLLAAVLVAAFAMPVLAQNAPAAAPAAPAATAPAAKPAHAKHKKHAKKHKKHKKHAKKSKNSKLYQGA